MDVLLFGRPSDYVVFQMLWAYGVVFGVLVVFVINFNPDENGADADTICHGLWGL